MSCDYVNDYEFVAIFYAHFQPVPDFLKKTILHFKCIRVCKHQRLMSCFKPLFLLMVKSLMFSTKSSPSQRAVYQHCRRRGAFDAQ
ncbi:hypothetical protein L1987_86140 [Smallanthus sonchifolius]|uniref:Uncharacterized protein n=1 Tax=Smallanthus sonchifolius TaxID=185202 RepID=A0ACB8XYY1_9ASTR|nr:hypothetical protein L1987_86140 [Smallanthus sonchifolius]